MTDYAKTGELSREDLVYSARQKLKSTKRKLELSSYKRWLVQRARKERQRRQRQLHISQLWNQRRWKEQVVNESSSRRSRSRRRETSLGFGHFIHQTIRNFNVGKMLPREDNVDVSSSSSSSSGPESEEHDLLSEDKDKESRRKKQRKYRLGTYQQEHQYGSSKFLSLRTLPTYKRNSTGTEIRTKQIGLQQHQFSFRHNAHDQGVRQSETISKLSRDMRDDDKAAPSLLLTGHNSREGGAPTNKSTTSTACPSQHPVEDAAGQTSCHYGTFTSKIET